MSELGFISLGFTSVMAVLCVLWLVCELIGIWYGKTAPQPKVNLPPADNATPAIPSAHLVAIAAALAEVMPAPHRIVSVYAPPHRSTGWIHESRSEIVTSHRIHNDWASTARGLRSNAPSSSDSHGDNT